MVVKMNKQNMSFVLIKDGIEYMIVEHMFMKDIIKNAEKFSAFFILYIQIS